MIIPNENLIYVKAWGSPQNRHHFRIDWSPLLWMRFSLGWIWLSRYSCSFNLHRDKKTRAINLRTYKLLLGLVARRELPRTHWWSACMNRLEILLPPLYCIKLTNNINSVPILPLDASCQIHLISLREAGDSPYLPIAETNICRWEYLRKPFYIPTEDPMYIT